MRKKKGGLFTYEGKMALAIVVTLILWAAVLVQVAQGLSR